MRTVSRSLLIFWAGVYVYACKVEVCMHVRWKDRIVTVTCHYLPTQHTKRKSGASDRHTAYVCVCVCVSACVVVSDLTTSNQRVCVSTFCPPIHTGSLRMRERRDPMSEISRNEAGIIMGVHPLMYATQAGVGEFPLKVEHHTMPQTESQ